MLRVIQAKRLCFFDALIPVPAIIPVPAKIISAHKIWPVDKFNSDVFWLIEAEGSLAILKPRSESGILKYSNANRNAP